MSDYSKRIPAAIVNAKKLLGDDVEQDYFWLFSPRFVLAVSEIALASTLWALLVHESRGGRDYMVDEPPAPLIAFTEKVERLSRDYLR